MYSVDGYHKISTVTSYKQMDTSTLFLNVREKQVGLDQSYNIPQICPLM